MTAQDEYVVTLQKFDKVTFAQVLTWKPTSVLENSRGIVKNLPGILP